MSIAIFFAVLFLLILVHEWGHFIVAKKTGMRVDEFGIGFPPKLFGVRKGGTEYTFNALPIGGFVRIYGENAIDAADDAAHGQVPSDSFVSKSKWAQAAVLVAGVTMNILLAWVLFAATFMIGVPTPIDGDSKQPSADLQVQGVVADSAAAAAGIPVGAVVEQVVVGEVVVSEPTPTEFADAVTGAAGDVTVTYSYDGANEEVQLTPSTGVLPDSPDRAAVGVSLAYIDTVQYSFLAALQQATIRTVDLLGAITVGLGNLIIDSFAGTADYSQIAGPVGIVGLVSDAAAIGLVALLTFTAVISLNLAIINLLPFPALDGGRLLFVAVEALIRRPINPVWVARLNGLGFVLLLALMAAVTYNDIVRLL